MLAEKSLSMQDAWHRHLAMPPPPPMETIFSWGLSVHMQEKVEKLVSAS